MESTIWLPSVMAIVGVIVGALITPYATSIIENKRVKKSLQPKLIKLIFKLYQLRGQQTVTHNYLELYMKGIHDSGNDLLGTNLSASDRQEIQRQHDALIEHHKDTYSRQDKFFDQLLDIESEIYSLIQEFQIYYGNTIHTLIQNTVHEKIKSNRKIKLLHDYQNLTNQEYRNVAKGIVNEVNKEMDELSGEGTKLINKVISIINH